MSYTISKLSVYFRWIANTLWNHIKFWFVLSFMRHMGYIWPYMWNSAVFLKVVVAGCLYKRYLTGLIQNIVEFFICCIEFAHGFTKHTQHKQCRCKIAKNFISYYIVSLHNSFGSSTKASFTLWHLLFQSLNFHALCISKWPTPVTSYRGWNRQGVKQTGGMQLKPDTLLHLIKGSSVSICRQIPSLSICVDISWCRNISTKIFMLQYE